jgi:hypothetical protein
MSSQRKAYSSLLYSHDPIVEFPRLVMIVDETPELYLTEPVFGGICEAKKVETYPKALWHRGGG